MHSTQTAALEMHDLKNIETKLEEIFIYNFIIPNNYLLIKLYFIYGAITVHHTITD